MSAALKIVEPTAPAEGLEGLAQQANAAHRRFIARGREAISAVLDAGRALRKAKKGVGRGECESWVERNCEFALRTAQYYMNADRRRADIEAQPVAFLKHALAAIAGNRTEEEQPRPADPRQINMADQFDWPILEDAHLRQAERETLLADRIAAGCNCPSCGFDLKGLFVRKPKPRRESWRVPPKGRYA